MDATRKDKFQNKQLNMNALPRSAQVEFYPLDPKYLIKLNIVTGTGALVALGVLLTAYFILEDYRDLFPFLAVLFLLLLFWFFYRNFELQKRNGYAVRERDIIYRRGFVYETTTIVPFNRVQHVSAGRDLLDKFLGITFLQIFSAGGSGSDISIPGLPPTTAEELKEEISQRISSNE